MNEACEPFEIDSERRAHGALGAAEARALDEHLTRCEHCRAFVTLVGQVEARLRHEANEATQQARWPAIERRLGERERQTRRSEWLVPVALFGAAGVVLLAGLPPRGALVMALGALLTTVAARWLSGRWLRELARAGSSREGLLAFSRRQVDDELRAARTASSALAVLAVSQVGVIEAIGRPAPLARLAVVGGGAMLLLVAARLRWSEVPRLEREREELA